MPRKRKPRNTIVESNNVSLIRPFDMTKFGTDDDPCFGKLNDPKAPECQRCGDFEFCAIVTAENIKRLRVKEESKTKFKDMNKTPKLEKIRQFMEKSLFKNSRVKTVALTVKKFGISKEKAKAIMKNI